MQISFHTDAFCSVFWTLEKCMQWAQKNDVRYIECGLIDGISAMHGLGYLPHLSSIDDPYEVRDLLDRYGVKISQLDAAFPLSDRRGQMYGVPFVMNAIRYAKLVGCTRVCTTDGLLKPAGLTDEEAMEIMKIGYRRIMDVADLYDIDVTIEIHGYFTNQIEQLDRMLHFCDSSHLTLNLDTGNSFISGGDPIEFATRFARKVANVHVKDVSKELAEQCRGNETGIALSHSAIGDGVNADNIRGTLKILHEIGYKGPISMECEGNGGPIIERSLAWLRKTLKELGITEG